MGDAEASRGEHHSLSFLGCTRSGSGFGYWAIVAVLGKSLKMMMMMMIIMRIDGSFKKQNVCCPTTILIYPHSNWAFIDKCLQNTLLLELHELHVFLIDLFLTV